MRRMTLVVAALALSAKPQLRRNPAALVARLEATARRGLTNYTGRTDPTNALSFLKIDSLSLGGGATLLFGAISNKTYTLQYTDNPGGGTWAKLVDVIAQGTNRTVSILDPNFKTDRFYRVVTPRHVRVLMARMFAIGLPAAVFVGPVVTTGRPK